METGDGCSVLFTGWLLLKTEGYLRRRLFYFKAGRYYLRRRLFYFRDGRYYLRRLFYFKDGRYFFWRRVATRGHRTSVRRTKCNINYFTQSLHVRYTRRCDLGVSAGSVFKGHTGWAKKYRDRNVIWPWEPRPLATGQRIIMGALCEKSHPVPGQRWPEWACDGLRAF